MCSMVCTEVQNQIKFVTRPHPTGSRTDYIYTDFGMNGTSAGIEITEPLPPLQV
jgi:hypothetical protein